MVTTANSGVGTALRDPQWIRNQIAAYLRAQGTNPDANPFAQRSLARADQVGSFMDLYDITDDQRQQFIQSWMAKQGWGSGGGGAWDFSRGGVQNRINQLGQQEDSLLRTGTPEDDIAMMREFQALANADRTNRWQRVADVGEQRRGNSFLEWFLNNPTGSGYYADYRAGRPNAAPANAGNPWASPAPGTVTGQPVSRGTKPTPTRAAPSAEFPYTTQGGALPSNDSSYWRFNAKGQLEYIGPDDAPAPYGASNADGRTYMPGERLPNGAIVPSGYPVWWPNDVTTASLQQMFPNAPDNPNRPAGTGAETWSRIRDGLQGQPTTTMTPWLDLLRRYGATVNADGTIRGNPLWSTEGYNTGAVQNPTSFRYGNMSGRGRLTQRGDPLGVFYYRLAQLMNQSKRGGNPAAGVTANADPNALAQLALQFVNTNLRAGGSTAQVYLDARGVPRVRM